MGSTAASVGTTLRVQVQVFGIWKDAGIPMAHAKCSAQGRDMPLFHCQEADELLQKTRMDEQ